MLKTIRKIIAIVFITLLTLLFLDFTGTIHKWASWMVQIQLIPAILALNILVLVGLVTITLIFGRLYCSVICPLGIFQDGISNIAIKIKGKKHRFHYSVAQLGLRCIVLALFIGAMVLGSSTIVSFLDPYAAYGRIASNFLAPVYRGGNNILALLAEHLDSYAFYTTEVVIKSGSILIIALLTLIAVSVLAWRNGRTYCNTICPVGTMLGFLSRFAIFRVTFDTEKCTNCKGCERKCKSSCIDVKTKSIDHSRCVTCFNCVNTCKFGAINYTPIKLRTKNNETSENTIKGQNDKQDGMSRRSALSILGLLALSTLTKAQQLHIDEGLAIIENKKPPTRKTPILPPGALSAENMRDHCTACQLCVSACPNNVLRPSGKLEAFMQPEMSFERGYCRPECVECSQVCPTSAIKPITVAQKSITSIGVAVWLKENCVVNRDEVQCNRCEMSCPKGAITLVSSDTGYSDSLKTPTINQKLCIGCGACEYQCPAQPFSAIYVEGNVRHYGTLGKTATLKINEESIACTNCGHCMPCPYAVNIPSVFAHFNRANKPSSSKDTNYEEARRAFLIGYDRSVHKLSQANHCIGCEICKPHCPQAIDIPNEMRRINLYTEQLKQKINF